MQIYYKTIFILSAAYGTVLLEWGYLEITLNHLIKIRTYYGATLLTRLYTKGVHLRKGT